MCVKMLSLCFRAQSEQIKYIINSLTRFSLWLFNIVVIKIEIEYMKRSLYLQCNAIQIAMGQISDSCEKYDLKCTKAFDMT